MSVEHYARDRTGEKCGKCKVGILGPTGEAYEKQKKGSSEGEIARAKKTYKCDKCGDEVESYGIGLNDRL